MKVKFNLDVEDYKESVQFFRWGIKETRNRYIFSVIQYPILIFIFFMVEGIFDTANQPRISYSIVCSIILGIIIGIIMNNYYVKKMMKKYKKYGGYFCEHIIEISEEGVRERTDLNDTLLCWENVKFVKENEKYIFICFKSMEIHTIPKRDFNSIEEVNEFYEKVITFWKKTTVS